MLSPPTDPAYSTGGNAAGQRHGTGWVDYGASPECDSDCSIAVVAGGGL